MMTSDAPFQYAIHIEEGVAFLDLNRPDEGNTLTRGMMAQLSEALKKLGARADVHVIAITARGSHFCKGRDGRGENAAGLSPYDQRHQLMGPVLGVYETVAQVPVPVVACVQGPAVGFGGALAAACDITLMSDAATFAFPEINHNIAPTMAMTAIRKSVPPKASLYLVYSGETIGPDLSVTYGLASRVWPAAGFAEESTKFLKALAAKPRILLETIKRFQDKSAGLSDEMASEYAGTLMALVRSHK
ncbi:MAG TPA: enoyl-CoA hydratase/isomerase family protein [Stellaceae bacterium]|jgi:enoyl-CoA hydratase/carnithine racemase|nr:enoyl-CoA hydratase/isomerase family protein [Stellaceae bacterium]